MNAVIDSTQIREILVSNNLINVLSGYALKAELPEEQLTDIVRAVVDHFALEGRRDGKINTIEHLIFAQLAESIHFIFDVVPVTELYAHPKGKMPRGKLYQRYRTLVRKFNKFETFSRIDTTPPPPPTEEDMSVEQAEVDLDEETYQGMLLELQGAGAKTDSNSIQKNLKATFKKRQEAIQNMGLLTDMELRFAANTYIFSIFYIEPKFVSSNWLVDLTSVQSKRKRFLNL